MTARTSPLILTTADNRFYEVYVGEETRSYANAVFTREPIYSRDLLSGREKLLWQDAEVSAWEKQFLKDNPRAERLSEDAEADDPTVSATGQSDILAVMGPYVLYDRWVMLEREDYQQADSSREAIDIRSGKAVSLSAVVRDTAILGPGAVREKDNVRWRHSGYDVVARWDEERGESRVFLRDRRGNEWTVGYLAARLPRIFWLDEPRVDPRLRNALATAFDDARADDIDTQLVLQHGLVQLASLNQ
ncbi:MAG TPA: hypothetical protein VF042_00400 [Gemmatimonadaceae bacterium]